MGKFNSKISAEFHPPKKWILERALSYQNDKIFSSALQDVGVTSMRIMTNNPRKLAGLSGYGELVVTERVPIIVDPIPENISYLETKKKKLGHMLDKKKSD